MYKDQKAKPLPITQVKTRLKNNQINPVYFLFGEDGFKLRDTANLIIKSASEGEINDFDFKTFNGSDATDAEIVSFCNEFPVISPRKIALVKNLNSVKSEYQYREKKKSEKKNEILEYAKNPSQETVLILLHNEKISTADRNKYDIFFKTNCAFEAQQESKKDIIQWVIEYCEIRKVKVEGNVADYIVELVGEDKFLIEKQLEKIIEFAQGGEISFLLVKTHVVPTREYNIFQLLDEIGNRDLAKSVKIAKSLYSQGEPVLIILFHLNKFVLNLLQLSELIASKATDSEITKATGINFYFIEKYKKAMNRYDFESLSNAAQSILKADLSLKSTSTDDETILIILISEIISYKFEKVKH